MDLPIPNSSTSKMDLMDRKISPWNKEVKKHHYENHDIFAYRIALSETNIRYHNIHRKPENRQTAKYATTNAGKRLTILNGFDRNEEIIPKIINSILARKSISAMSSLCVIVPSECEDSSSNSSQENVVVYNSDSAFEPDQDLHDQIQSQLLMSRK